MLTNETLLKYYKNFEIFVHPLKKPRGLDPEQDLMGFVSLPINDIKGFFVTFFFFFLKFISLLICFRFNLLLFDHFKRTVVVEFSLSTHKQTH